MLAPQSRLAVAEGFGRSNRFIDLQGEAYVDVTTLTDAPFVVRTGTVTTRVLGTTFDIRHYSEDSAVHVTVVTGKVIANGPRTQVTLSAGMVGRLTDSTATATPGGNLSRYTDWTQGRLVFDGTPVPALLAALGRWYGYDFRLVDSTLVHERVTAEFQAGAPTETMEGLKRVLNVTMTFDGTVITLHPRSGGNAMPVSNQGHELLSQSTEVGR
jgi:ferric-dicitrate binding protein FerR (iron transport regulator)